KLMPGTLHNAPVIEGQLLFNGLAIYYTEFKEFGIKNIDNEEKEKAERQLLRGKNVKDKVNKEYEAKNKSIEEKKLYQICAPNQWPKGDGVVATNLADAMRPK
ncbi:MAG: hypothetical protein GXP08_18780, partial [Gammaproteobacteria bacterium]|nr:hypothetical protein [Gammaproteobacteria bacterium]